VRMRSGFIFVPECFDVKKESERGAINPEGEDYLWLRERDATLIHCRQARGDDIFPSYHQTRNSNSEPPDDSYERLLIQCTIRGEGRMAIVQCLNVNTRSDIHNEKAVPIL
jgi:hypothetical protein